MTCHDPAVACFSLRPPRLRRALRSQSLPCGIRHFHATQGRLEHTEPGPYTRPGAGPGIAAIAPHVDSRRRLIELREVSSGLCFCFPFPGLLPSSAFRLLTPALLRSSWLETDLNGTPLDTVTKQDLPHVRADHTGDAARQHSNAVRHPRGVRCRSQVAGKGTCAQSPGREVVTNPFMDVVTCTEPRRAWPPKSSSVTTTLFTSETPDT